MLPLEYGPIGKRLSVPSNLNLTHFTSLHFFTSGQVFGWSRGAYMSQESLSLTFALILQFLIGRSYLLSLSSFFNLAAAASFVLNRT